MVSEIDVKVTAVFAKMEFRHFMSQVKRKWKEWKESEELLMRKKRGRTGEIDAISRFYTETS